MNLHSIKFAIEVDQRLLSPDHSHVTDIKGHRVLDWKLGMGPCGRWVGALRADIDMATVRITQESYSKDRSEDVKALHAYSDALMIASPRQKVGGLSEHLRLRRSLEADRKVETFIYKLEDVRGRIKAVQR